MRQPSALEPEITPEIEPARWKPGDRLTLRGENWTVVRSTAHQDCEALRVAAERDRRPRTFLLPFDRPRRIRGARLTVVSARAWWHRFRQLLVDAYPHGGLRFYPDGLDVVPYQLEPALATLRDGHARLLIADDVGLGKTIEAGLILRELVERQDGFRAILLVPAGLRQQWSDELSTWFETRVIFADAAWLRTAGRSLPADLNPWSLPGIYLSSFDFVKRPEALHPLEDVRWDLLIVDEAHAASLATDRLAAIDAIAGRALRLVLLTATPPPEPSQFEALCRIGLAGGATDLAIFQRGPESQDRPRRRGRLLAVRITDAERRMHRILEEYTTLVWREARTSGNDQARLVTTILRKRALSGAAALERSLRRRLELLSGAPPEPERQLWLPLSDEEDTREDTVTDALLGSSGLHDRVNEHRWLTEAIAAASAATDSKARVLVRLLNRIREPAIVFTEYRDTLESLQRLLSKFNLSTCILHGGLTSSERRQSLTEFGRGRKILLATDAAAEGLNLQHCRIVVHYELPWNPSRMLQRAGRVDRIGQQRRVHEIALIASDTAESLVLVPLARRAAGWLGTAGAGRMLELLTESRVAQAVFDGSVPDLHKQPANGVASARLNLLDDALAEARRLTSRRALIKSLPAARGKFAEIPITTVRRCSLPRGVVLLFELTLLDAGEIVERSLVAIHSALTLPGWPRRPAHIRRRIVEMLPLLTDKTAAALHEIGRDRIATARPRYLLAASRLRARKEAVRSIHESAARRLVQAGLFDRRSAHSPVIHEQARIDLVQTAEPKGAVSADDGRLSSSTDLRAILLISPR